MSVCVFLVACVCSSVFYACVTYVYVSSTYIKPNVSSKQEKGNPNEEMKFGTWLKFICNLAASLAFPATGIVNMTVIALCQSKQLKQNQTTAIKTRKLLNLATLPDKYATDTFIPRPPDHRIRLDRSRAVRNTWYIR